MESKKARIEAEITSMFNEEYCEDLMNLDKCKNLLQKYTNLKKTSEKQLELKDNESRLFKAVAEIKEKTLQVVNLVDRSDNLVEELEEELNELEDTRRAVQEHIDNFNTLQTILQYYRVLESVADLSSVLQLELDNKDDEKCVTIYANLCEISRNLTDCAALNLRNHLREMITHWHELLKQKFSEDYDEQLKLIKWPFTSANFSLQTPAQSNVHKLQIVAEYLLQVELPDEAIMPSSVNKGVLADFKELSLPIHFLVVPLRKRFLYHFYGGRQTNRIDKPEWYFTQILTWIRDHVDFVTKWIQPIIDKLGLHHIDAKLEFMRGLVQVAVEKLNSDLPNLQYDDFTFSHSVDEALGFEKELRESYAYPSSQPSILTVLTQAHIFLKWLSMEKKFATEKMDIMLSSSASSSPFQSITPTTPDPSSELTNSSSTSDASAITTCADQFVTLLQTITERYEALPSPGHRLQFLELQLELLDDFRVRLLQLVNREMTEGGALMETRVPKIVNTVYYVENVLGDWGAMLHYLNLFYYKSQLVNAEANKNEDPVIDGFYGSPGFELETETVFADTLSLYRHMRKDLLCTLAESVIREAKSKTYEYRRENWNSIRPQKELRSYSLTPTACPMFEVLSSRLHQLHKSLAGKLFTIVWRFIAQQLDHYLLEALVLDNRFNDGGAMQLKYDITRNLFALFSQFSEKPDSYFLQINAACILLNISKGSALLLRETLIALEGATGVEDRREHTLKELGVVNVPPAKAVEVLNRRTDITTNRLVID